MKKYIFYLLLIIAGTNHLVTSCTTEEENDIEMSDLLEEFDSGSTQGYDDVCRTIEREPVPEWRSTFNAVGTQIFSYYVLVKRTCVRCAKQSLETTQHYFTRMRTTLGL